MIYPRSEMLLVLIRAAKESIKQLTSFGLKKWPIFLSATGAQTSVYKFPILFMPIVQ